MKRWLRPDSYERRYRRFLKKTNKEVWDEFLYRIGNFKWLKASKNLPTTEQPINESNVQEQQSKDIDELTAGMLLWWATKMAAVSYTVLGYFDAVNGFNDDQFRLVVKDVFKIDLPTSSSKPWDGKPISPLDIMLAKFGDKADVYRQEPYLAGIKDNWLKTQTVYTNKTVVNTLHDLDLILRNSTVSQAAKDRVIVAINDKFGVTERRFDQFGRQQVNSLDTQLSESRQQSIGSEEYEWDTQQDERVRGNPYGLYPNAVPSHYARQGEIFRWDSPPTGGHPGEAPGCRCRAIMRLSR